MDARNALRTLARIAGCAALMSSLAAAVTPAVAGPADKRLERSEREQLRDELARQPRGERDPQERGRKNGTEVGWNRSEDGRPSDRQARPDRHRMDPQEREQLRHMLREHRRGQRQ